MLEEAETLTHIGYTHVNTVIYIHMQSQLHTYTGTLTQGETYNRGNRISIWITNTHASLSDAGEKLFAKV